MRYLLIASKVFDNFDPVKVALYDDVNVAELMANPGIIRNRLKIQAAIINAKAFLPLVETHGSFDKFIWEYVDNQPIVGNRTPTIGMIFSPPLQLNQGIIR